MGNQIVVREALLGSLELKIDEFGNIIIVKNRVNEGALIKAFDEGLPNYKHLDDIIRALRILTYTFDDLEDKLRS